MPDAYSHKTIKNPGCEKNAECGMRNWESIQFVFLPHSAFPIPHSGNRWLGPRTPSLREGPGSASVPSGSPDPAAGTGARVLGNEPSQLSPEATSHQPPRDVLGAVWSPGRVIVSLSHWERVAEGRVRVATPG